MGGPSNLFISAPLPLFRDGGLMSPADYKNQRTSRLSNRRGQPVSFPQLRQVSRLDALRRRLEGPSPSLDLAVEAKGAPACASTVRALPGRKRGQKRGNGFGRMAPHLTELVGFNS